MSARFDVVVCGGGPVGCATAAAFLQAGFSVALVEPAGPPQMQELPDDELRFYALSPASVASLAALGCWSGAPLRRACAYASMRVWDVDEAQELRFDARDVGRAELGFIVDHASLATALWERVPGEALLRDRVEGTTPAPGESRQVRLASGRELSCSLLVAADGARSPLREALGIGSSGWPYPQRGIVGNVRLESGHGHTAWQRFLPSGPLALLPLASGACSIVWSAEVARAEALMGLDDAGFATELGDALGGRFGEVSCLTPRQAFALHWAHAEAYVAPGFALVGDAAHSIHPLAGQGLNLGFADASTLVQVVAAARDEGRAWAGLRTLSRYERSRRASTLEMGIVTDALYRAFDRRLPGWDALRGWGLHAVSRIGPLREFLARQAAGA